MLDLDSNKLRRLTNNSAIDTEPVWAPDGRKLVLTLGGADGNLDIFVMDIATKEINRLTTNRAIDTEGTWTPDRQACADAWRCGRQSGYLSRQWP